MIERHFVTPKNTYTKGPHGRKVRYTPVIVVQTDDHAHVYVSGRTARLSNGDLAGIGDMRTQIRVVCENIRTALASVGATLDDVVRTTTYTTDMDEYLRCYDERFEFFKEPLPTSSLIGVSRLVLPEVLVEIEVEAIMDPQLLRVPTDD